MDMIYGGDGSDLIFGGRGKGRLFAFLLVSMLSKDGTKKKRERERGVQATRTMAHSSRYLFSFSFSPQCADSIRGQRGNDVIFGGAKGVSGRFPRLFNRRRESLTSLLRFADARTTFRGISATT